MSIIVKLANQSDIAEISLLIKNVYGNAIAPTYSNEGNEEFYKYIEIKAIDKRFSNEHWTLKAVDGDNIVGIIEIRKNEHLSMLFVDTNHQKQGIGQQLLTNAIVRISQLNPKQKTLSVHSTPNAVIAYQKLGFKSKKAEQIVNGIRFVTMEKSLI